jgi:hypothetical protein
MQVEPRIVFTAISLILLAFFIYVAQNVFSPRLKGLEGYRQFLYILTVIITLITLAQIGYV